MHHTKLKYYLADSMCLSGYKHNNPVCEISALTGNS